jgi:UDP-N-acetylmuramoylalanine--D-glutamate ligase
MPSDLTGQNIAILGAGRSGLGAARLVRKLGGTAVVFDDGDPLKLLGALQNLKDDAFTSVIGLDAAASSVVDTKFSLVVTSPGLDASWPLPRVFTDAGVPLIGEIEFAWQNTSVPAIAITGTNGKTTTTELTALILNECGHKTIPCGNYGLALCEVVQGGESYDVLTVEVSSFQLETITTFHPAVSVWLNFAPDHLDRYPDVESYYKAKLRVFENQTADDWVILRHGEDIGDVAPRRITFSAERGVDSADFIYADDAIWFRGERIAGAPDTKLRGRHNIENLMASLAVGWTRGLAFGQMMEAAAKYEPARHRCELVRVVDGREYINDSKATNLHALEACLKSQDEPVVLIAGGKEKGLDYSPFRPLLKEKVTALVTLGEIGQSLARLFEDLVPVRCVNSVPESVEAATEMAAPGQTIIFSPGTSSFDMFSGYVERGNVFREAVLALP